MQQKILEFWFEELQPSQWWIKDKAMDEEIAHRFSEIHSQARRCELYDWRNTAQGRLAEVIVLDQFPRNMFRDSPLAFATDTLALALAQEAVLSGADQQLTPLQRSVLYLPYMHSESRAIHELALALFEQNGINSSLSFEIRHKEIIDRFGRYPHRNKILERQSTAEEHEYLQREHSGF